MSRKNLVLIVGVVLFATAGAFGACVAGVPPFGEALTMDGPDVDIPRDEWNGLSPNQRFALPPGDAGLVAVPATSMPEPRGMRCGQGVCAPDQICCAALALCYPADCMDCCRALADPPVRDPRLTAPREGPAGPMPPPIDDPAAAVTTPRIPR